VGGAPLTNPSPSNVFSILDRPRRCFYFTEPSIMKLDRSVVASSDRLGALRCHRLKTSNS
jgi:hypothetical protein